MTPWASGTKVAVEEGGKDKRSVIRQLPMKGLDDIC
jgi:hypothetical protein